MTGIRIERLPRIALSILGLLLTQATGLTAQNLPADFNPRNPADRPLETDLLVGRQHRLDPGESAGEPAIAYDSDHEAYRVFYSRQIDGTSPNQRIHVQSVTGHGLPYPHDVRRAHPTLTGQPALATETIDETHPAAAYGTSTISANRVTLVVYIENERTIKGYFWNPQGQNQSRGESFVISESLRLKGRPRVIFHQDHPTAPRSGSWRVFWSNQAWEGGPFELKSQRISYNRFSSSPGFGSTQQHGRITGSTHFDVESNGYYSVAALLVPHQHRSEHVVLQTLLFTQVGLRASDEKDLESDRFTAPIRVAAGARNDSREVGSLGYSFESNFLVALRQAIWVPNGNITQIQGLPIQALEQNSRYSVEVGDANPLTSIPEGRFPYYDLSYDADRSEYRLTANSDRLRGFHIESLRIDESGRSVPENEEWRGVYDRRPHTHLLDLLVTDADRVTNLTTATPTGEEVGIMLFRQDQRLTLQAFRRGARLAGRTPQEPASIRLTTTAPYIPFNQTVTVLAEMPVLHTGRISGPSEMALQVRVQDARGAIRIHESALDRIDGVRVRIDFNTGWRAGRTVWDWRVVDSRGRTAPAATGEWAEGGSFEVVRALRGDVNRDGRINVTDAFNILNYLYMGTIHPRFDRTAADVNADGRVTLTDCIYLLNWLFRGGPSALPMP